MMVYLPRKEFEAIARAQKARAQERKAKRQEKGSVLFPKSTVDIDAHITAHLRQEALAKKESRKARANSNAKFLAKVKGQKPILVSRGTLKEQCVRLLGLQDRMRFGNACRIHGFPCLGSLAYHLIEQARGDAARLLPCNVRWACSAANWGEKNNRRLYRQKHVNIFGQELIERIEEYAGQEVHISTVALFDLRHALKNALETGVYLSDLEVTRILGIPEFDTAPFFTLPNLLREDYGQEKNS